MRELLNIRNIKHRMFIIKRNTTCTLYETEENLREMFIITFAID